MNVKGQILRLGSSLHFQICGTHDRNIMLCFSSGLRNGVASKGSKDTSNVPTGSFGFPILRNLITVSETTLCYDPKERTQWSRVFEKLTGSQPVKKFSAFYGTRRLITLLTNASHLSLSWARSIPSISPYPPSWRSILILSSHLLLGLPCGLFPSGFPTKTLYKPLLSPIRVTCPTHLILLDFIARTKLDENADH